MHGIVYSNVVLYNTYSPENVLSSTKHTYGNGMAPIAPNPPRPAIASSQVSTWPALPCL